MRKRPHVGSYNEYEILGLDIACGILAEQIGFHRSVTLPRSFRQHYKFVIEKGAAKPLQAASLWIISTPIL